MKKLRLFFFVILCALSACFSEPPESEAARQAEAAEARMDAEAARMVAAADSVRAADGPTADSLSRQAPASSR